MSSNIRHLCIIWSKALQGYDLSDPLLELDKFHLNSVYNFQWLV